MITSAKGDSPLTYTKEIIDCLIKCLPIDSEKITAFGICSGASGAWQMAISYPDLFAAIATASFGDMTPSTDIVKLRNKNFWFFNNDNDMTTPISQIKETTAYMCKQKINHNLTIGHNQHDSWTMAMGKYKVLAWLASQKKGSHYPPPGSIINGKHSLYETNYLFFSSDIIDSHHFTNASQKYKHKQYNTQ
ncbi:MAG: hypothetical protein Q4C95_13040 [Planctomycetia bacterium]|nr:hypothetical protein [Planctomycetia bacterium]